MDPKKKKAMQGTRPLTSRVCPAPLGLLAPEMSGGGGRPKFYSFVIASKKCQRSTIPLPTHLVPGPMRHFNCSATSLFPPRGIGSPCTSGLRPGTPSRAANQLMLVRPLQVLFWSESVLRMHCQLNTVHPSCPHNPVLWNSLSDQYRMYPYAE